MNKRENEYLARAQAAAMAHMGAHAKRWDCTKACIHLTRWPTNAIPGRTREELAAASAASIIAPNAEAMRVELALERDRAAVAALKARVDEINQDVAIARETLRR